MQTTTLSFANFHNHGELFANMMRARRERFIEHRKWNLPEAMGMEYDQYDTPASRWVVVHDEAGRVMAGNRLTPTTAQCGMYSYMIRDAQRGLLDTIPDHLLYEDAPVDPMVWESSRLFVAQDVPASIRRRVHTQLIAELGASARAVGASHCLTLLSASWPRWCDRVGVKMKAMGPVMEIDGVENQVVMMDFTSALH
jgi:N-acyl-L-homoserine lactone synthetase